MTKYPNPNEARRPKDRSLCLIAGDSTISGLVIPSSLGISSFVPCRNYSGRCRECPPWHSVKRVSIVHSRARNGTEARFLQRLRPWA